MVKRKDALQALWLIALSDVSTHTETFRLNQSKFVLRGFLFFLLITLHFDTPAQAQQDDPPISGGGFYIWREGQIVEYSRRGALIYYLQPTSQLDLDIDEYGNWVEDGVYLVGWTDFGIGGEFGYTPDGVTFQPTSDPNWVNAYRPPPEFVGILLLGLIVDDAASIYDDPPVTTNPPYKVTVWEFTISPSTPYGWRPRPDTDVGSFTAEITPSSDHRGNSMAAVIGFVLDSSSEPSYCLNDCCQGGYAFCLANGRPVFPFCAYDIPFPGEFPEIQCPWNQMLVFLGEGWRTTTVADRDLKFPPNQPGLIINAWGWPADCSYAATTQPVLRASVRVTCLDYGAYGSLTANCYHPLVGELIVAARLPAPDDALSASLIMSGLLDADYSIGIPYSWDGDVLADSWEAQHGEKGDAPGKDEDDTPAGDGTRGDGLSAYEEYRGLVCLRQWMDFDPKQKDMFVMNFGAGNLDPFVGPIVEPKIPNDAITSPNGFPGAGMPQLWLLNANEGFGYPYRVVNFLNKSFHNRLVYAAVLVPGEIEGYSDLDKDGQPDDVNGDGVIDDRDLWVDVCCYGFTYGPIWDNAGGPIDPPGEWGYIPQFWGPPVIEIDVDYITDDCLDPKTNPNGLTKLQVLTWVIGHELGHTVLWHQPGYGHHKGNTTYDCLIWEWMDWRENPPTEFCVTNPGDQTRWKVNP